MDGLAYKFVPIKTSIEESGGGMSMGRIDTDTMYAHVKKWSWKNTNGDIYVDPESRKNSIMFRLNLGRLADEFIKEGKLDKAEEILDMYIDNMPIERYGYNSLLIGYVESYYTINKPEKARKIVKFLVSNFQEKVFYSSNLDPYDFSQNFRDLEGVLDLYKYVIAICVEFDSEEYSGKMKEDFMSSVSLLEEALEEE
jgi:hypothetical protein